MHLEKVVELKTKEMNRVKRLAKNILDQVCRLYSNVVGVPVYSLKLGSELVYLAERKSTFGVPL